jgi:hypothetical protein
MGGAWDRFTRRGHGCSFNQDADDHAEAVRAVVARETLPDRLWKAAETVGSGWFYVSRKETAALLHEARDEIRRLTPLSGKASEQYVEAPPASEKPEKKEKA